MVSQKAKDSLNKVLAKLNDKVANPPEDVTAEELEELKQSILDITANLERWG